jgi:uncharacterized protein (DUF2141 family)
MSNSLAIAAVTATLRDILGLVSQRLPFDPDPDPDLNDATCSTKPPDKARTAEGANQLNLFLYQASINPHLRNADLPGQVRPGETGPAALTLDLDYVVTAYGKNSDDILAHRLLGRAMSLLHDRSVLLPADIEKALKGNDLHRQVERVRITPHPLTSEELSKLWAVFQAPYRISATYRASVVLIDSVRRTRAPLPVLGLGVGSLPSVTPAFPTIERIALPSPGQPAARLPHALPPAPAAADAITILGHDFTGTTLRVSLGHRLLAAPLTFPAASPTARSIALSLPDDQDNIPVGTYAVSVIASQGPDPAMDRTSNEVSLAIAPRIRTITPAPAVRNPQGRVTITVATSPQIWPAQRASLILGDAELVARPRTTKTAALLFDLAQLPAGTRTYAVRLRVDGIDSLAVDYAASPPAFDPTQTLEVQ